MNLTRCALPILLVLTVVGCDKSSGSPAPAASSSAPAASSSAPAAASSAPSVAAPVDWEGPYTAKVGKVTPPPAAKMKLWEKDPGKVGVGTGTIKLTVSGKQITGELTGALGDLLLTGELDDKVVTARVDPKDPNAAETWSGTLTGKLEGDGLTVTLRVASRDANLAREVDAKLTRR